MKRFVAIAAAVLLMAALFAGCGSSSAAGKYVLKSMDGQDVNEALKADLEEVGMSLDEYLELFEIETLEEFMTVELKSDGNAVVSVAGEDEDTGTWEQDGDKVIITIDDESVTFTLNGNELSAEIDEQEYVFVKK